MDGVRQYILTVTAAALLCAILQQVMPPSGLNGSLIKLVSGIFLAFVVISPVKDVDFGDFRVYLQDYAMEGENLSAVGEDLSADAMARIIKNQTEAYILDKAEALSVVLTVDVELNTALAPDSVRLSGNVSPYARSVLERVLTEELGIAREDQIWIG